VAQSGFTVSKDGSIMTDLDTLSHVTMEGLGFLSTLFVFVIGLAMLAIAIVFIVDVTQTKDAQSH